MNVRTVTAHRRPGLASGLVWGYAIMLSAAPVALGGGFDRAIEVATQRVVKLYGLGAGDQPGYGTGVLVSQDGLVLTVFSLLIDAQTVRAVDWKGRRYTAQVIHRDPGRQLALLRLTPAADGVRQNEDTEVLSLPFFDLARKSEVRSGDWVLAAGNAFKVADDDELVSIAHGVFSKRTSLDASRGVKDFPYRLDVLVIDAITSNPGGPGSALVNLEGEFLGMIGRLVSSNLTHTDFNYAVPPDVLYEFFVEATDPVARDKALASQQVPEAATEAFDPGIKLARVGYRRKLPLVERVRPGSPAGVAGLRKDDLILSINGKPVPDVDDYDARMATLRFGEPIVLVVRRGRRILTVSIPTEEP